jgi:hypothetical protein
MLTFKAWKEKGYDTGGRVYGGQIRRLPEMTSHVTGEILPQVMSKFVKSKQWRECEEALLTLADAQSAEGTTRSAEEAGAAHAKFEAGDTCGTVEVNHKPPRTHGFPANMVHHDKIATVVNRHAPNWRVGSNAYRNETLLEEICRDLDEAGVDIPKSWKNGLTPSLKGVKVRNWQEALELGTKKLVADQINTSLKTVRLGAETRPSPNAT